MFLSCGYKYPKPNTKLAPLLFFFYYSFLETHYNLSPTTTDLHIIIISILIYHLKSYMLLSELNYTLEMRVKRFCVSLASLYSY